MVRPNYSVALAIALLSMIVVSATVAGAEGERTSFWVEEMDLDLGTVIAGETATATFVFHNDGPEDIRIIRAKPS